MKLEAEILLNRFRCEAELLRLAQVAEQKQERAEEHGRGRADGYERELEEIERRITETLNRHGAWAQK